MAACGQEVAWLRGRVSRIRVALWRAPPFLSDRGAVTQPTASRAPTVPVIRGGTQTGSRELRLVGKTARKQVAARGVGPTEGQERG